MQNQLLWLSQLMHQLSRARVINHSFLEVAPMQLARAPHKSSWPTPLLVSWEKNNWLHISTEIQKLPGQDCDFKDSCKVHSTPSTSKDQMQTNFSISTSQLELWSVFQVLHLKRVDSWCDSEFSGDAFDILFCFPTPAKVANSDIVERQINCQTASGLVNVDDTQLRSVASSLPTHIGMERLMSLSNQSENQAWICCAICMRVSNAI